MFCQDSQVGEIHLPIGIEICCAGHFRCCGKPTGGKEKKVILPNTVRTIEIATL